MSSAPATPEAATAGGGGLPPREAPGAGGSAGLPGSPPPAAATPAGDAQLRAMEGGGSPEQSSHSPSSAAPPSPTPSPTDHTPRKERFYRWRHLWRSLPTAAKATLVLSVVTAVLQVAYGITAVSFRSFDEEAHIATVIVMISLFNVYATYDAVIFENTPQLVSGIILSTLMLARVLWFISTRPTSTTTLLPLKVIWGALNAAAQVLFILLALVSCRQFGWRLYSKLGVDRRRKGAGGLLRLHLVACAFNALVKLDLMFLVIVSALGIDVAVERRVAVDGVLLGVSFASFAVGAALAWVIVKVASSSAWAARAKWMDALMPLAFACPVALIVLYPRRSVDVANAGLSLNLACIVFMVMRACLWVLVRAVVYNIDTMTFQNGHMTLRDPASTTPAALDAALGPLQEGAWLGKPSQRNAHKMRFFQLSHDGSTLRWGWRKFVLMYYVQEIHYNEPGLSVTLTFLLDPELTLVFSDESTFAAWRRGLSHLLVILLTPEHTPSHTPPTTLDNDNRDNSPPNRLLHQDTSTLEARLANAAIVVTGAAQGDSPKPPLPPPLPPRPSASASGVVPMLQLPQPGEEWPATSMLGDSGQLEKRQRLALLLQQVAAAGRARVPGFVGYVAPWGSERLRTAASAEFAEEGTSVPPSKHQRPSLVQMVSMATQTERNERSGTAPLLLNTPRSTDDDMGGDAFGSRDFQLPGGDAEVAASYLAALGAAAAGGAAAAAGGGVGPGSDDTPGLSQSGASSTVGTISRGGTPAATPRSARGAFVPRLALALQRGAAAASPRERGVGAATPRSARTPTPRGTTPLSTPGREKAVMRANYYSAAEYWRNLTHEQQQQHAEQGQQVQQGTTSPLSASPFPAFTVPSAARVAAAAGISAGLSLGNTPLVSPRDPLVSPRRELLARGGIPLSPHGDAAMPADPGPSTAFLRKGSSGDAAPPEGDAAFGTMLPANRFGPAAAGPGSPASAIDFGLMLQSPNSSWLSAQPSAPAPPSGMPPPLAISVDVIDYEELEIGKLLGAGSEGAVYAAWLRETPVAVKRFARMEDALNEVRMHLGVGSHDNVVALRALCSHQGGMLMVLEYCARGTLDVMVHHSAKQQWDPARLLPIVRSIARGMHHLHARGIVHRDLKPANIFVGQGQTMKIGDFGLSKLLALGPGGPPALRRVSPGFRGTPQYAAPELINEALRPEGDDDVEWAMKLDVWSFGVTLWEVMERRRPFEGLSEWGVQAQWLNSPYEARLPPVKLPEALDRTWKRVLRGLADLVEDCTRLDPLARPSFGDILRRLRQLESQRTGGRTAYAG